MFGCMGADIILFCYIKKLVWPVLTSFTFHIYDNLFLMPAVSLWETVCVTVHNNLYSEMCLIMHTVCTCKRDVGEGSIIYVEVTDRGTKAHLSAYRDIFNSPATTIKEKKEKGSAETHPYFTICTRILLFFQSLPSSVKLCHHRIIKIYYLKTRHIRTSILDFGEVAIYKTLEQKHH